MRLCERHTDHLVSLIIDASMPQCGSRLNPPSERRIHSRVKSHKGPSPESQCHPLYLPVLLIPCEVVHSLSLWEKPLLRAFTPLQPTKSTFIIIAPACKLFDTRIKRPLHTHQVSESLPLANINLLKACLNQTQKNNGSQLISCTYFFFELITD